ncbi:MAG: hypothetical protein CW338_02950 [Clostridiales bacterium]|nr:hypothetical protein [Clostridiales bacterium]
MWRRDIRVLCFYISFCSGLLFSCTDGMFYSCMFLCLPDGVCYNECRGHQGEAAGRAARRPGTILPAEKKGNREMKMKIRMIAALLLCLALLLPAGFCLGEEQPYVSDFSAGCDGWEARGKKVRIEPDGGVLKITGRMGVRQGAGRELRLEPGRQYWLCAEILHNDSGSIKFILCQLDSPESGRLVKKLGTTAVSGGSRTRVYAPVTADETGILYLSIETDSKPLVDWTLCSFKVLTEDPYKLSAVTWEGELPVLRDVCAPYFDIGTCFSGYDATNAARRQLVAAQYSIITPENELKPDAVLDVNASRVLAKTDDTAVAVHFSNALPILNFARDNGLKVHGHVLVWHSQTPEAFFHEGYDPAKPYVTREVMLARLDNYIRLVFEYMDASYPGLIVSWDVVNEAVGDGSDRLRVSNWTRVVGDDFVLRAFEIADKYAPDDVLLCYNDYSTPYEPKLTGICNLLEALAAEGHIDGYGFQTHYSVGDPSLVAVKNAFDRVSALGLKLRVSEMDIKVSADTDINRQAQADFYRDLFLLYLSYDMEAVQVWGVCDGTSWISANFPLPFDAKLNPKPAFFAIVNAVKEAQ